MASKQDLLSQFQMRKLIIFENSTGFKDWTCRQRGKLQADSRSEMRTMSGSVSWCHGSDSDVVLSEIGCTKFDGYHFGVHLPGILLEVYILHFQRKSCECWVPPTLGLIIPWSKLDELLIFGEGHQSVKRFIHCTQYKNFLIAGWCGMTINHIPCFDQADLVPCLLQLVRRRNKEVRIPKRVHPVCEEGRLPGGFPTWVLSDWPPKKVDVGMGQYL